MNMSETKHKAMVGLAVGVLTFIAMILLVSSFPYKMTIKDWFLILVACILVGLIIPFAQPAPRGMTAAERMGYETRRGELIAESEIGRRRRW
jgi:hypothetical protein